MLEGLAGQAASTGRKTGACYCSCRSAISVGEARWSGPLELPQCRTAPLHCPSASRQLCYTVSWLVCDSSTSSPACSTRFCRGVGWGTTCLCRDTGGKGTLPAQCTGFNTLDNWGHKTPTQSKRKRTGKKRLKGHGLEHVYNTCGYTSLYDLVPF